MIANIVIRFVVVLLLLTISSIAQHKSYVVKLLVFHDAREKPPPDYVILSFDKQSVRIPVRDGKFEVPVEIVNSEKFTFDTDIGDDHIKFSGIRRSFLECEFWTLYLAELQYSVFQLAVPKGTTISKSCVLAVDSYHGTGVFTIAPKCRSKRK